MRERKYFTYNCKNCGLEKKAYNASNTYCSNQCQGEARHKDAIERFLRGEVSDRNTLREILKELNGNTCDDCKIPGEYNGKPIVLQVDHRDGNAGDNFPSNVRLLCPNCHSQTPTFGAKNKGKGRASRGLPLK